MEVDEQVYNVETAFKESLGVEVTSLMAHPKLLRFILGVHELNMIYRLGRLKSLWEELPWVVLIYC